MREELFISFPHYGEPSVADYSSALLYHGELIVPAIPVGEASLNAYERVAAAAESGPLHQVFQLADAAFQKHVRLWGIAEEYLEPVSSRLRYLQMDYPASPSHFKSLGVVSTELRRALAESIHDPLFFCTASIEFIWRVHSYLDACDDNVDDVLSLLEATARDLGDPLLLFPDSFLNRMFGALTLSNVESVVSAKSLSPVTSSPTAMRLAQAMTAGIVPEKPTHGSITRMLSFNFFSQILDNRLPPMRGAGAELVSRLLEKHGEAITSLRSKCLTEASDLTLNTPSPETLDIAVKRAFGRMIDEAAEVLELDKKADTQFRKGLLEDPYIWASPAVLLGALSLPPEAVVTAVVGIMARVGATATKLQLAKLTTLAKSPYSLLHYIEKERPK